MFYSTFYSLLLVIAPFGLLVAAEEEVYFQDIVQDAFQATLQEIVEKRCASEEGGAFQKPSQKGAQEKVQKPSQAVVQESSQVSAQMPFQERGQSLPQEDIQRLSQEKVQEIVQKPLQGEELVQGADKQSPQKVPSRPYTTQMLNKAPAETGQILDEISASSSSCYGQSVISKPLDRKRVQQGTSPSQEPSRSTEQEQQCKEFPINIKKPLVGSDDEKTACPEGYTVNFEDVPVVQLIRFISQIAEMNFVYDSKDLKDVKITIVSDEPASVKDLMASLLQVLRMNNLSVVEQGTNVLIYKDQALAKVSTIITDDNAKTAGNTPVVTRVFRLYNLSPNKVSTIIRPLLSKDAIVEESPETRHLIVSDITVNVNKIAELLTALDTPNAALDIAEYQVKSAYPAVLVTYAKEILAPLAQNNPIQFIAQPSAHKIFVVSTPYLIAKAMHVLCSLDLPEITEATDVPPSHVAGNNFYVYKLKYRSGKAIAQAIRDIGANLRYMSSSSVDLISVIYSIQWIEANNSLVISGTQEAVSKVSKLIDDLDVAPKQVYIEVLIIDTTIANSLGFGVEWIALAKEQNKLAFASGFLNPPPTTAPAASLTGLPQAPLFGGARNAMNSPPPNPSRGGAPGTGGDVPLTQGFGLGIVGNIIKHNGTNFLTLGALVTALEADSDTTIVLNPRIMAQDTYEANFFVGQNIPYQTTSTIVRDTGSVTQNLQYEDIGVQLRVTPHIGPNNMVTLQIDQAVSDVVSPTATIASVGQGPTLLLAPTTSKTLATTRVHVPDGCFLVMSGHIRDMLSLSRSGIPCLGTLPLVGPAFSTTVEARTKRNLIMFLRPCVVSDAEDGVNLTNKEGYDFNWESDPSSVETCPPKRAPEWESCENPPPGGDKGWGVEALFKP